MSDLDVILFDLRGLKFTFRLRQPDLDADGKPIEDIYFGEDGALRSKRFEELLQYGDIIADELERRAPAPLVQQAIQQGATRAPRMPVPAGRPTGYAPPQQAQQACPGCGGSLGPPKQTSKGRVRECQQEYGACANAKGYPTSVWIDQMR